MFILLHNRCLSIKAKCLKIPPPWSLEDNKVAKISFVVIMLSKTVMLQSMTYTTPEDPQMSPGYCKATVNESSQGIHHFHHLSFDTKSQKLRITYLAKIMYINNPILPDVIMKRSQLGILHDTILGCLCAVSVL